MVPLSATFFVFLAAGEQEEGRFDNSFGSPALSEILFIFKSIGRIETPRVPWCNVRGTFVGYGCLMFLFKKGERKRK